MKQELVIADLSQIKTVAQTFLKSIDEKRIFCFDGDMGAGKTTFINALLAEMKVVDASSSPTYSILNEHLSPEYGKIFHLDLYRLNSEEEAFDIGIEDIIYDDYFCFIEWPTKISNLLPDNCVWVTIEVNADFNRIISFSL